MYGYAMPRQYTMLKNAPYVVIPVFKCKELNGAYWELLERELKHYAAEIGLDYVTNDDSIKWSFDAPPVIVNYFYHEQIKKSARKVQQ